MKLAAILMLALFAATPRAAEEKEAEALAKQLHEMGGKVVAALADIKDKADAEKAKPALVNLFDAMASAEKQFRALPEEDKKRMEETWKPKFDAMRDRFRKESARLGKDEAIAKVLADVGPFKNLGREKEFAARAQVLQIETALQAYRLKNEIYPKTIEELAKGDKPFLEKKALADPWGNPYQYDAAGPKNKGLKPDVWTKNPKGELIGNWKDK